MNTVESEASYNLENVFSSKRYFINNIDSYHGQAILAQVSKTLARNDIIPEKEKESSLQALMLGEDVIEPPPIVRRPEHQWEIYGTVSDPKITKVKNVAKILPKDEILNLTLLNCGTVIWDVSYDRAELELCLEYLKHLKMLLELQSPGDGDSSGAGETKMRYLVLISTVMTWASTKPLDPENADMPFIESDFRKRKPHMNYKLHYDCENEVIMLTRNNRSQISATVIGVGVTYGGKEDVLYYWFQKAWECERFLPIIGRGSNVIPIINVLDFAQIVYNLISDFPRKLYILAVEQNISKQREIIKPLGRQVGTGMFVCTPEEDAFLIPEMTQRIYDLMTLNLNLEPTFIVETMALEWTSELTFAENVPILIKQFKKERGLKSFKVMVYGPPFVGKTTLSKEISLNYGIVYVSPETIIEDTIREMQWRVDHWDKGGELIGLGALPEDDEPDPEDVDDETTIETTKTTLASLTSGRMCSEEEIIQFIRLRFLSHEAQNKGWVLDGFPTTIAQCTLLFEIGEDGGADEVDEEGKEEDAQFEEDAELYATVLKKLLPDLVVSLEATDEFICEKAVDQPDSETRVDEDVIFRRLTEFRIADDRNITPLNFFDEIDIHPFVLKVDNPKDYSMKEIYKEVTLRLGRPCRYPKLLARIEEAEKKERSESEAKRNKAEKASQELEKRLKEELEDRMEYWTELYAMIREDEEAALAAASEPMRSYLMTHIFPTLVPALLEIARLRPVDPIDFLAEYLFKQNPSGKMLEPGYNLQAEMILNRVKILDDTLKDLDIVIDPLLPPELQYVDPKSVKKVIEPMSNL